MRLIDADKLYDKAEEKYKKSSGFYRPIYRGLVDDIANSPTVDAVEVVRCKDCKHSEIWGLEKSLGGDPRDTRVCLCGNRPHWTRDDDFCSYGERRSNG